MRKFTSRQRALLLGLSLALITIVGLMGWSVQATLRSTTPSLSLLPTPLPGPTASPSPTRRLVPTPSSTPFFETGQAGTIAREVATARDLMPRWETPLTLVDTHEMSVILYHHYQDQIPFPLSERKTLEAAGLWPASEVQPDPVVQSQVTAALYFPKEGQLYLRRDWTGDETTQEILIAYGYALALPDQYGDLARLRDEPSSLDRRLALDALAAGDALIALWRYAGVQPGTPQADAIMDEIVKATLPQWRIEAPLLDRLARLPLELGRDFAIERYSTGGLSALDEAVRRPPRATEQLLHPETYDTWEGLTAFDPISISLGSNWSLTHTETVGEAMMHVILDEWEMEAVTETVSGWNGDLLQLWKGPEDGEVVLWQTAWDSNRQASAFEWAMREILPDRVRGVSQSPAPEELPNGKWWTGRWGSAFLRRYDGRVWLVWGNDSDAVKQIGTTLP